MNKVPASTIQHIIKRCAPTNNTNTATTKYILSSYIHQYNSSVSYQQVTSSPRSSIIRYYSSTNVATATSSSSQSNIKSNTSWTPSESSEHNFIKGETYEEVYNNFKWNVPEYFNIGYDICDKHSTTSKRNHIAIVYEDENGNVKKITFGELQQQSNALCNLLASNDVQIGDRVGVLLSQGIETALSHVSVFRSGAITIPLFTLFGPEALSYRLSNSDTKCVFTDYDQLDKLLSIRDQVPSLKKIIVFETTNGQRKPIDTKYKDFVVEWDKVKATYAGKPFTPVRSKSDDPALIIFTSGTTGNPKGCLHAHRVLIGHLPGVQLPQGFFPYHKQKGQNLSNTDKLMFYTPADWAWIGGLIDVLLPSLFYGVTVLAHRASKFDATKIHDMMIRHGVTSTFLPPTALKMMRQQQDRLAPNSHIISVGSGGESLGDQLLEFGRKTFGGTTINEFYGQTEANLLVGNGSPLMPVKLGSMGRAIPGHRVEIVDDSGKVLPTGNVGNIALSTPDPVVFLRYWNNPKATKDKYVGQWLLTGDLGKKDEDGYFWYVGRDDDIINSSGYRIGPSEIEHSLIGHKAVAMAAVIGVPDELRGEVVKAYIVLNSNYKPSTALENEIKEYVKVNLAAHEYPRLLEFVDSLPMTTTGKIIRRELRERHRLSTQKK
uniref:medium-chain acyl-CoA ligase n=1 Tax=Cavenderia deminutiva TaxID=361123 RepID=A0A1L2FUL4_9MYCE|nr:putative acetyl-CoA synthetase [Cavenderia deminutiva]